MGDSRALPGFGQVDLDIEDEPSAPVLRPTPTEGFGRVEFDPGDEDESQPPSNSRVFNTEKNRPTRRNMASVHDQSTRVFDGDELARATLPPSPLSNEDGNTRAWADVDEALLSVGELDAYGPAAPASRSGNASASSSGSGVAHRDDKVAAMRELYARGDADGALALAATLGQSLAPPPGPDHPDASVMVEFGEQSIDLDDPYGGLILLDDELAAAPTVPPAAYVPSVAPAAHAPPVAYVPSVAPAAPLLTLTERHSIPRVLKSTAEVSKLKIDHRAGFLLAHFDGMQTLEEILDICAMPPVEALGLISKLRAMGVIELE
jgi:hypothetical protein